MKFRLRITPNLIKCANRNFFIRYLGITGFVAPLILLFIIAYLYYSNFSDVIVGGLLTLIILYIVIFVFAYIHNKKVALDVLARMDDGLVDYNLTDKDITISSSLGSSTLKWELIKELWCFDRC